MKIFFVKRKLRNLKVLFRAQELLKQRENFATKKTVEKQILFLAQNNQINRWVLFAKEKMRVLLYFIFK